MSQPGDTVAHQIASDTPMSKTERAAAILVENNIGNLPGRDGITLRLMQFSTFGRSDTATTKINESRRDIAESIIRLLTAHGYRISR